MCPTLLVDRSPLAACCSPRLFKALRDQVVERVLDERLDEVVVGVVALGIVRTRGKDQRPLARVLLKRRLVLEQPLVDRTELLDVQRRVVHSNELPVLGVLVETERAEAAEKHVVAEVAVGEWPDSSMAKEITGERGEPESLAGAVGLEEPEGREEGQP